MPSILAISDGPISSAETTKFIQTTGIASAEAFGTPTVGTAIAPTGIPSAEAFGTPQLNLIIYINGIASAEAFGTATVGAVIAPTGITSEEAFGTPSVGLNITPASIVSAEAFGTPTVSIEDIQFIEPTGIPSAEAFGTPKIRVPFVPPAPIPPIYEYADESGNIWRYDESTNTYIKIGIISAPQTATEEQNGLASAHTIRLLREIETQISNGISFKINKIALRQDLLRSRNIDLEDTTYNPYFYLLASTDDLVRFEPETLLDGTRRLKIELNRQRLLQLLTRTPCVGGQGLRGLKGDTGLPGLPADKEVFHTPTKVEPEKLTFSTSVRVPLPNEPISIRIFRNEEPYFEVLYYENGTQIESTSYVPGFEIDLTKTTLFYKGITLNGTIVLKSGLFDPGSGVWLIKVRQRGEKGVAGRDGMSALESLSRPYFDETIRYNKAIGSLRAAKGKDLNYILADLSKIPPATSIQLLPDAIQRAPEVVAVEYVGDASKAIGAYRFNDADIKIDDLSFPSWTAMEQCADKRRYDLAPFKWQEEISGKEENCFDLSVPFSILNDPTPPDISCKDDFFLCANLGDTCGIGVDLNGVVVTQESDPNADGTDEGSSGGSGGGNTSSSSSSQSSSSSTFDSSSSSSSSSSDIFESSSSSSESGDSSSSSDSSDSSQSSSSSSSSSESMSS